MTGLPPGADDDVLDPPDCEHDTFRCLRCSNAGCLEPGCPGQAFDSGLCRSCGHFEKMRA